MKTGSIEMGRFRVNRAIQKKEKMDETGKFYFD